MTGDLFPAWVGVILAVSVMMNAPYGNMKTVSKTEINTVGGGPK